MWGSAQCFTVRRREVGCRRSLTLGEEEGGQLRNMELIDENEPCYTPMAPNPRVCRGGSGVLPAETKQAHMGEALELAEHGTRAAASAEGGGKGRHSKRNRWGVGYALVLPDYAQHKLATREGGSGANNVPRLTLVLR